METISELLAVRRQKLDALRAGGEEPFGGRFETVGTVNDAREAFAEGKVLRVAGRITAHRDMGKSRFLDVSDFTGRIQVFVHAKELAEGRFEIFKQLDIGDWIGVEGECFVTRTGEPTVRVKSFAVLSKSLRPLPEKWHGVQDAETKYRQRYLDLIANPESREVFQKRFLIVREIRRFME
ncbi:MAG: OB-fold nucleic acid binding domain-containing protein, partial [Anaerorhabdus sp.]|uniref:OB-fold nucleic acid binding domain-containing protein n=1 Tax=Anaerorhabdus sp. TaxID=1872524 RepID=UPI003A8802F7